MKAIVEAVGDRYRHPVNQYAPVLSELIGIGQTISGLSEAIYGVCKIGAVENGNNRRAGVALLCVAALCYHTWTVLRSGENEE